jgi:hypothetical protein
VLGISLSLRGKTGRRSLWIEPALKVLYASFHAANLPESKQPFKDSPNRAQYCHQKAEGNRDAPVDFRQDLDHDIQSGLFARQSLGKIESLPHDEGPKQHSTQVSRKILPAKQLSEAPVGHLSVVRHTRLPPRSPIRNRGHFNPSRRFSCASFAGTPVLKSADR